MIIVSSFLLSASIDLIEITHTHRSSLPSHQRPHSAIIQNSTLQIWRVSWARWQTRRYAVGKLRVLPLLMQKSVKTWMRVCCVVVWIISALLSRCMIAWLNCTTAIDCGLHPLCVILGSLCLYADHGMVYWMRSKSCNVQSYVLALRVAEWYAISMPSVAFSSSTLKQPEFLLVEDKKNWRH